MGVSGPADAAGPAPPDAAGCATRLPAQLSKLTLPRARLLAQVGSIETSEFTYWLNSPPPPPGTDSSPSSSDTGAETIAAPEFYNTSIPDAPPGLTWWEYLPDVPPLADPATLLGPAYAR